MAQNGNERLKSLSIKELTNNKLLYSKVLTLMEQQKSYSYILRYLNSKGYKMAKGSLTNLKKKISEANQAGTTVSQIADKRNKDNIDDISDNKVVGFKGKNTVVNAQSAMTAIPIKIYSEDQILESIMSKGMKAIDESDYVDPQILLKAIDLHAKYFGQKSRGLTSEGLKQYQLIMQAEFMAVREVFFRYIPKDKQEEALKAMDKETDKVLSQIGVTKQGKELIKELRKADLPLK